MKKLTLYTILFFSFIQLKAQDGVLFKMAYQPNKDYATTMKMNMVFIVDLSGDQEILDKMKQSGFTPPIDAVMNMSLSGHTVTGAFDANKNFPAKISFKFDDMSVKVGDREMPIPQNAFGNETTIYGHVGADGKLKADSLNGNNLRDTAEQKVSQLLNTIHNKIKFPDHPLRVGDTFVQEIPLNIPIANNNPKVDIKATYKLVSINNGKAYFDILQNGNITVNVKEVNLVITGTGMGKMVYDIKNTYPTNYKTDLDLKVDGKVKTLVIKGDVKLNAEYNYIIK